MLLRSGRPNIHSLPGDLLLNIGAYLEHSKLELGSMELASKRFYDVLSRPSAAAPCKFPLDLDFCHPLTPRKSRYLQRRILRYKHIVSYFSDELLKCREDPDEGTAPPLLPSLLATCAPSAELFLKVSPDKGENFFKITFGANSESDSFQAKLVQRLTELELHVDLGVHGAQDLESLALLTALQRLEVQPYKSTSRPHGCPHYELAWKIVALRIPNLVSLELSNIAEGAFILSCPKLEILRVEDSWSLHIEVEKAALDVLEVRESEDVQVDLPVEQLQRLRSFHYGGHSMVDKHLIEDMRQMTALQELEFENCLAGCFPSSYPQSLRKISIQPWQWCQDLPRGLKDLRNLEDFSFMCTCKTWDITKPLGEFLPVHGLKCLALGVDTFSPKEIREIASKKSIRCRNPWWLTK